MNNTQPSSVEGQSGLDKPRQKWKDNLVVSILVVVMFLVSIASTEDHRFFSLSHTSSFFALVLGGIVEFPLRLLMFLVTPTLFLFRGGDAQGFGIFLFTIFTFFGTPIVWFLVFKYIAQFIGFLLGSLNSLFLRHLLSIIFVGTIFLLLIVSGVISLPIIGNLGSQYYENQCLSGKLTYSFKTSNLEGKEVGALANTPFDCFDDILQEKTLSFTYINFMNYVYNFLHGTVSSPTPTGLVGYCASLSSTNHVLITGDDIGSIPQDSTYQEYCIYRLGLQPDSEQYFGTDKRNSFLCEEFGKQAGVEEGKKCDKFFTDFAVARTQSEKERLQNQPENTDIHIKKVIEKLQPDDRLITHVLIAPYKYDDVITVAIGAAEKNLASSLSMPVDKTVVDRAEQIFVTSDGRFTLKNAKPFSFTSSVIDHKDITGDVKIESTNSVYFEATFQNHTAYLPINIPASFYKGNGPTSIAFDYKFTGGKGDVDGSLSFGTKDNQFDETLYGSFDKKDYQQSVIIPANFNDHFFFLQGDTFTKSVVDGLISGVQLLYDREVVIDGAQPLGYRITLKTQESSPKTYVIYVDDGGYAFVR